MYDLAPVNARGFLSLYIGTILRSLGKLRKYKYFLVFSRRTQLVENFSKNVDKIVDKIVFVVYNRGRKDKYEVKRRN